ncbi:MAG TPA: aminotransferase class I/II-fold pyridoxal phosphate-dependent enzyme, partial [Clostridia bacterium]|nr:aminotransferase class I/II-fold pyridoxal phosphate-dependent enzyme [Clostridia bacterium]
MNWEDKIAQRAKELPPSGIRRFFDIVKTMKGAISLGIGEPDFVTPWHIRKAAITGIERGHTQYTGNSGLIELRREISAYLKGRFDIEYNPDNELLVTIGASEAIDLALRALLDPGDEVVVPDPSYVSYMPNIYIAGGKAVPVKITAQHEFRLTPEALKSVITPRTKALILPYPNNPTGGIMPRRELEAIADVIRDTDIVVISDEIYAELTYQGTHVSFASIPGMYERTLVVSGFSKAFAMTGWRLGYAAGNKDII